MQFSRIRFARWIKGSIVFPLAALACLPLQAQEFPKWEAFTGFSYARLNLGQQSPLFQPTDPNYYGMEFNAGYNPSPWLRLLLCDFAVELGGTQVDLRPLRTDLRTTQLLFGPEFVSRPGRATVFGHTLIGLTNTRLVSSVGSTDIVPDVAARTNLAFGVGGGVDLGLTRLISVRPVQADYIPTSIAGSWENYFRVSTGVVFRWHYRQSGAAIR